MIWKCFVTSHPSYHHHVSSCWISDRALKGLNSYCNPCDGDCWQTKQDNNGHKIKTTFSTGKRVTKSRCKLENGHVCTEQLSAVKWMMLWFRCEAQVPSLGELPTKYRHTHRDWSHSMGWDTTDQINSTIMEACMIIGPPGWICHSGQSNMMYLCHD